jgi:hypothetical protein
LSSSNHRHGHAIGVAGKARILKSSPPVYNGLDPREGPPEGAAHTSKTKRQNDGVQGLLQDKILAVERRRSDGEIKRAYRKLAAGVVLDLLDEIERLRAQLRRAGLEI